MNGAQAVVRTLVGSGVTTCFANPGTSEMHFVAALDAIPEMRGVLCLFEGVATGAADGYGRMTGRPAAALLHLGPGLANGLANLHNTKRAQSPVVNIVGEHATFHRCFNAPLTADIEALARSVSGWVRTVTDARCVAADGAAAVAAALVAPGQVATLILPADLAWSDGSGVASVAPVPPRPAVTSAKVDAAARILRGGEPTVLLLGGVALRADGLAIADSIAAKSSVRLLAETFNARMERGAGRVPIERVPYFVDQAVVLFKEVRHVILVGASAPVAFFGYPGKPSALTPPGCNIQMLAATHEDLIEALAALADAIGASARRGTVRRIDKPPAVPSRGAITADAIATTLGALLPEGAIICDESVTTGRGFFPMTCGAAPHDWLQLMGGAIGEGLPLATGAAVACPDRKVISLEADGSGMYTLQSLWTQAREGLSVMTLIWANRVYAILRHELASLGADNPGRKALDMLSLGNPNLDWVSLAKGMGVEGRRVETVDELVAAFRAGVAATGPFLIEVVL
jgi:acetolactate synthase I/II/III large subunit